MLNKAAASTRKYDLVCIQTW